MVACGYTSRNDVNVHSNIAKHCSTEKIPMPYETPPWTQIVAHRGNSGPMPENTLIAINSAIDLGVDMVEIDVRLTSDGIPVLMHSDRVDHTTNGTGFVSDMAWDEFIALDAGSWRGSEFSGERVCSLEHVLEATAGRMPLNLDIKTPGAAEMTAIAVVGAGASDSVVITGCTEDCVRTVARVSGRISTLLNLDELLVGINPADAPAVALEAVDVANELGAIAINVPFAVADTDLVDRARAVGIGVWVYTVDDKDRFRDLIDIGVDSLTTNWPERMLPLVGGRVATQRIDNA
jgi:glycerophosphoryl diester phosphodiesterase